MRQFSGYVQDELLERIKNHPLRGNRTQQEFYEYIFQRFLDLPESRLAMLEQDLRSLRLQVDFLKERVEHTESLDKVVQNLDSQMQQFASSDAEVSEESHDAATTASAEDAQACSCSAPAQPGPISASSADQKAVSPRYFRRRRQGRASWTG